jgi:alkanesulfonate monooxygenase SsuD/methylene tetrahydromethanopterin reductase-like flavin-dependent oxidoreductase (luciferase family)
MMIPLRCGEHHRYPEEDNGVQIGIGLPNTVLGVPGRLLVDWARRAEERGFSSLATIDRIAYPSYDSLTALTVAAAATDRIGLLTNVLLAPAYQPVHLAKVTACLDQISEGRLTLGLGVGGRPDDYQLTGRSFHDRGRRFDQDLELLHQAWAGEPVAGSQFPVAPPTIRGRVPLLIGGQPALAAPRAARWGAGFTIGGAPPEMAAGAIQEFKAAWEQAGGSGRPRVVVLAYYSLGEEHTEESLHNLRSYYGFLGDWAEQVASGASRTPEAVRRAAAAFQEAGVDELVFDPTVADLDQVDRLADEVGDYNTAR